MPLKIEPVDEARRTSGQLFQIAQRGSMKHGGVFCSISKPAWGGIELKPSAQKKTCRLVVDYRPLFDTCASSRAERVELWRRPELRDATQDENGGRWDEEHSDVDDG